jgi:trehalose 6-phosphate synthase
VSDVCVTPTARDEPSTVREHPTNPRRSSTDALCTREQVYVSDELARGYHRYADDVLRPITHSAPGHVTASEDWESYHGVNEHVATTISELVRDGAVVWSIGYQFAPLAELVRSRVPDETFLFHYWPEPWPAWDTLRVCPCVEATVEGLLSDDLLAFDTPRYRDNFLRAVDELFPDAEVDRQARQVVHDESPTAIRSLPRGVSVDRVQQLAVSRTSIGFVSRFREDHGIAADRPVVVGLGRTEDAAGVSYCLGALEGLWADSAREREAFTFVLCDESGRSRAPDPDSDGFGGVVPRLVERINRRFSTADWRPVVSHSEYLTDGERYALYRDAAVGVASSVHGSGIPESAEFVASQSADPGVLLLSSRTETNNRFEESALIFSPLDRRSFLDRLDEGFVLGPDERRRRNSHLRQRVQGYDDETWLQYVEGTIRGIEQRRATSRSST